MAAAANAPSIATLLGELTRSLTTATEATDKVGSIQPSKDGISLLDVKNELLLSYLQNLVFLILLKIQKAKSSTNRELSDELASLDNQVVKKLVELRLYLEKGARPLEDKLRYQIEKVLRAADDAERAQKIAVTSAATSKSNGKDGDEEEDDDDDESGSSDDDDDEEDDPAASTNNISDLQYRPNLAAFARPKNPSASSTSKSGKTTATPTGAYKPPRVAPTVMPTTERREKAADRRKPMRSAIMDEFIADEMSSAPTAIPSVGTTIRDGGNRVRTTADRKVEDERREYEEKNFVRLPKESKKDRLRNGTGGKPREVFGGEDWRELGEGVDRINRVTARKGGTGGAKGLLDKSRKRPRDTQDGPRADGGGIEMGEKYQKRLRTLQNERRDRGKRR